MKQIVFLGSVFLLALFSCVNTTNRPALPFLEKTDSAKIYINDGNGVPFHFQFIHYNNKKALIYKFFYEQKLRIIDLEAKQEVASIPIKSFRHVSNFYYHNQDSIFVMFYDESNPDIYIDSVLFVLMNHNGDILRYYSFPSENILNRHNLIKNHNDADPLLLPSHYGDFKLVDNKIFMLLERYHNYPFGTDSFLLTKSPIVGYYDIKKDTFITSHTVWYPDMEKGQYYPREYQVACLTFNKENRPLISFTHSNKIIEWDYKTDTYKLIKLKNPIFDTILPMQTPSSSQSYEVDVANFGSYYNVNLDKYFFYSSFNIMSYGQRANLISIYDNRFHFIGSLFNEHVKSVSYFDEPLLVNIRYAHDTMTIFWNKLRMKYDVDTAQYYQKIRDSLRTLKEKFLGKLGCQLDTASDELKTDLYGDYLNTLIHKDSYYVLSIVAGDGCFHCVDAMVRFLDINKKAFSLQDSVYVVISGRSMKEMQDFLKNTRFSDGNFVIIDTNRKVNVFYGNHLKNPRLTFVQHRKVVNDTIYPADRIYKGLIYRLVDIVERSIKDARSKNKQGNK